MKKGTVHFTLGDDAGKLLMQIAQEALLYELDPEKAIKVITTSLMGVRIISLSRYLKVIWSV